VSNRVAGDALYRVVAPMPKRNAGRKYPMAAMKPIVIGHWIARLIAGGILVMGALPKFTGGAAALADKLPGGNSAAIAIGVAEVIAVVLMFIPKTTMLGSGLAAVIMLGAIGSHLVGPVGMQGEFASMFAMAVVAFLASASATAIAWRRDHRLPTTA
jgi:hypothetical protein